MKEPIEFDFEERERTRKAQFKKELEHLINKHCMENTCNTPDFILAEHICNCLEAFAKATNTRINWFKK
jgi:hypothetical protein